MYFYGLMKIRLGVLGCTDSRLHVQARFASQSQGATSPLLSLFPLLEVGYRIDGTVATSYAGRGADAVIPHRLNIVQPPFPWWLWAGA